MDGLKNQLEVSACNLVYNSRLRVLKRSGTILIHFTETDPTSECHLGGSPQKNNRMAFHNASFPTILGLRGLQEPEHEPVLR